MRVKVKVIPKARRPRTEQSAEGLKVYLAEPACEGKANKRLLEVLAGYFNTKKYKIKIIKGKKQREKIVEIGEVV